MKLHKLNHSKKQAGFSMLEVLISLVLIAFALLGQAGLQASAIKFNKGAALRMQAVMLSDEIAERIENNKSGDYTAATSSAPTAQGTDCATNDCSPAQLSNFDMAAWTARVAATLQSPSWTITRGAGTNPATYTIVLTWQDRRDNARSTTYSTAGTAETFSITSTKDVYQ